jgi:hypothetical protein
MHLQAEAHILLEISLAVISQNVLGGELLLVYHRDISCKAEKISNLKNYIFTI